MSVRLRWKGVVNNIDADACVHGVTHCALLQPLLSPTTEDCVIMARLPPWFPGVDAVTLHTNFTPHHGVNKKQERVDLVVLKDLTAGLAFCVGAREIDFPSDQMFDQNSKTTGVIFPTRRI